MITVGGMVFMLQSLKSSFSNFIDVNSYELIADMVLPSTKVSSLSLSIICAKISFYKDAFDIMNKNPNKKYVLITTRDTSINQDMADQCPPNLIRWFGNNVNVLHPKIRCIPIGLPPLNTQISSEKADGVTRRKYISELMNKKRKTTNLVYLNARTTTNIDERDCLYKFFSDKEWVTIKGGSDRINYVEYINDIHSHKYIISPNGNGIDCHRTWESLYLSSIPIVKKSICMSYFQDLPIIYVDDYRQITPDFLEEESKKISLKSKDMLDFNYWKKEIFLDAEKHY